jgi:hypothetical protein
MKIKLGSLFCFVLVSAATLGSAGLLLGQTNAPARILFLHLKLKGPHITLVDATSVPGFLKSSRIVQGDIRYELISTNGAALWQGAMTDPRGEQPDFPASEKSDNTPRQRPARPDELDFTLRVPDLAAAQRIDFYTLTAATDGTTNAVKKVLGRLTLTATTRLAR